MTTARTVKLCFVRQDTTTTMADGRPEEVLCYKNAATGATVTFHATATAFSWAITLQKTERKQGLKVVDLAVKGLSDNVNKFGAAHKWATWPLHVSA